MQRRIILHKLYIKETAYFLLKMRDACEKYREQNTDRLFREMHFTLHILFLNPFVRKLRQCLKYYPEIRSVITSARNCHNKIRIKHIMLTVK